MSFFHIFIFWVVILGYPALSASLSFTPVTGQDKIAQSHYACFTPNSQNSTMTIGVKP